MTGVSPIRNVIEPLRADGELYACPCCYMRLWTNEEASKSARFVTGKTMGRTNMMQTSSAEARMETSV